MDLSYLANLSSLEFELERCRIIGDFLDSVPDDLRGKILTTQIKIDEIRDAVSKDDFLQYLCGEMSESLENLVDQFVAIRNALQ